MYAEQLNHREIDRRNGEMIDYDKIAGPRFAGRGPSLDGRDMAPVHGGKSCSRAHQQRQRAGRNFYNAGACADVHRAVEAPG